MSLFSKRHYVWLASVGRDLSCSTFEDQRHGYPAIFFDTLIEKLADALERENPDGFDRDRFLRNVFGPFNAQDGDEKCPTQPAPRN